MLMKRDLQISDEPMVFYYGIKLHYDQYQKIKRKLELLKEKCPAHSAIKLRFEKRNHEFIADISIKSFAKNFDARKSGPSPYQAYLFLEEEIEEQLLNWKRKRFSEDLEKTLLNSFPLRKAI